MTKENIISLTRAIRAMVQPGVGLALCKINVLHPPLWPDEDHAISRAVPARIREFTAGRTAARQAMTDAGLPPAPVTTNRDRAPRWPDGLSGSITHTAHIAAAIVARQQDWPGLGLDLESACAMDDGMAELIRHPLDHPPPFLPPALASTLLFSAKEAAFKAQFPLTGLWIDYRAVALQFSASEFSLNVQGVPLTGQWCTVHEIFATTVLITDHQAALLRGSRQQSIR
ncbi:phosphopantetheinyl transferase [Paracoccus sp. Ld10]|uniref:phosphopantetheinyl transferase n=1 Tax=Paracoccus sp. Ld10 TaxID=649158 RepID=UPI00386457C8